MSPEMQQRLRVDLEVGVDPVCPQLAKQEVSRNEFLFCLGLNFWSKSVRVTIFAPFRATKYGSHCQTGCSGFSQLDYLLEW